MTVKKNSFAISLPPSEDLNELISCLHYIPHYLHAEVSVITGHLTVYTESIPKFSTHTRASEMETILVCLVEFGGCLSVCTHVDDGVRLDVVHIGVAEAQLLASPLGGADDAGGDSVLQGERAADGNHKLTRTQVRRSPEQQHRQLHLLHQPHKNKLLYCCYA